MNDLERALLDAAARGDPLGRAGDALGASRVTTYRTARKLGLTAPRPERPGLKDQVLAMDRAGHGVVAIAGALGISSELANYHLRQAHVQPRRSRHSTTSMASALRLYAEGATWEDIENRTGIPKSALRPAVQRTGTRRPDRAPIGPPPLAPRREGEAWMNRAMVDYLHDRIAEEAAAMDRERDAMARERRAWPRRPLEGPLNESAGEVDLDLCMEVLMRVVRKYSPQKPIRFRQKRSGDPPMQSYTITAKWDANASVWTSESDIPGLVIEAPTLTDFFRQASELAEEMIQLNK